MRTLSRDTRCGTVDVAILLPAGDTEKVKFDPFKAKLNLVCSMVCAENAAHKQFMLYGSVLVRLEQAKCRWLSSGHETVADLRERGLIGKFFKLHGISGFSSGRLLELC